MQLIIFTDLDGSLLDHDGYSFAAALPALARVRQAGIPLVVTTSKTRREVEPLQRELGLREPFIVENGAAVFLPCGYRGWEIADGEPRGDYRLIRLGATYPAVRRFVASHAKRFGIRGFGDMTPEEVSGLTGLDPAEAALAQAREFSEPFLLGRADEIAPLAALAAEAGLKVTRGGRFHHLIGERQDKGAAVRAVRALFAARMEPPPVAIGIGDSENDLPMLAEVEIPVLIPRPRQGPLETRLPGLIRATAPGSRGWNEAVGRLLDDCGVAAENGYHPRQEEMQ